MLCVLHKNPPGGTQPDDVAYQQSLHTPVYDAAQEVPGDDITFDSYPCSRADFNAVPSVPHAIDVARGILATGIGTDEIVGNYDTG